MILASSSTCQASHRTSLDSKRNSCNASNFSSSSGSWQVPAEFLGRLEPGEIIRQSAIHEIITGEAEYLDDLNTYQKLFIDPLHDQLSPSIFQHIELERFSKQVISSIGEIRRFSRNFLKRLRQRQQAQQPLIESIADIILCVVLEWGPAYTKYAADHPLGELEIDRQINQNPLFAEHVANIPRFNPRKKDFRHFYSRPTFRLARYVLLFTRLFDSTPEHHADRDSLRIALELVRRQCVGCDTAVGSQQDVVKLNKLNFMIAPKSDIPLLHLHSPHRKIYSSGKMLRKKEGSSSLGEWSEVLVVLFDHYLVILKEKKDDGHPRPRYHIIEQPIRTEFLKISGLNQPPEKRPRRLKTLTDGLLGNHTNSILNPAAQFNGRSSSPRRTNSEPGHQPSCNPVLATSAEIEQCLSSQQSRNLYPITLQPFGDSPRMITLYVDSELARQHWRERFESAIGHRLQSIKTSQVFELWPLALETFSIPSSSSSSSSLANLPSLAELKVLYEDQIPKELLPNTVHHGAPTCSVPFTSPDGRPLIAIGCKEGLWIGRRDKSSSFRKVLPVRNITQITFMPTEGYMIVLAAHVLLAYPLEILVCSQATEPPRPPRVRSITTNLNPTYLPKPPRPAVPYYQQQPHQQVLSRATSASSQQSSRSRQSALGTESDTMLSSGRSSLVLSLGTFEFEGKQLNDDETPFLSSGCDETVVSPASLHKPCRFETDSSESSVPSSPALSTGRFKEFYPTGMDPNKFRRKTSDSIPQADRRKSTQIQTPKNHWASIPLETQTDAEKPRGLVRLSGLSGKVKFFRVGQLQNRTVLIYAEKARGSYTLLKVLQPVSAASDPSGHQFIFFKEYKEFLLPFEAHDLQFHENQSKLLVLHGNRCNVINFDDMESVTIPSLEENRAEPAWNILMKRIEEARLLRVLSITSKEYLFCYDKFAYFGNTSGDVVRKKFDKMIEWDGRPFRVTRYQDYVIGYSENLIEVWDLRTSARVQIMHGKDVRCIYDGELAREGDGKISHSKVANWPRKPGKLTCSTDGISCYNPVAQASPSSAQPSETCHDNAKGANEKSPNSKPEEPQLSIRTNSLSPVEKHFESFHVSIRDSGNVFRVFEMAVPLR